MDMVQGTTAFERRSIVITCWFPQRRNGRAETTDVASGKREIVEIFVAHWELQCRLTGVEGCPGNNRYWDPMPGEAAWAEIRWEPRFGKMLPRAYAVRCAACEERARATPPTPDSHGA